MLTRLVARNFKRFGKVDVELGSPVLFIGPNNSGKTSALQALALWQVGLSRWIEKRGDQKAPEKRSGVAINRRDLVALPVPNANLLWRDLHVRDVTQSNGKPQTRNVRIDLTVEGVDNGQLWECGLEFDYANEESFYCRPLRLSEDKSPNRMSVPPVATDVRVAFLPPMSGLAANETRLDRGAVNVRVGEGRTAEVLRNLCYTIHGSADGSWPRLEEAIRSNFGVSIEAPQYVAERGEIEMTYKEHGVTLDLSSSGRGLQQTLLVLAYMYANRGAVLLLDEPDAHLEILRQRQIYQLLVDVAKENDNQIIAASHSEVLLNEAADRDVVIAFVGAPHRIDDRGSQVAKALKEIGFEDYYQAELAGWVLYLEGSTDLAILRAFARTLGLQEANAALERPFVHYVGNQPNEVLRHFHGLREAVPELKGVALFDRRDQPLPESLGAMGLEWSRREIENYVCYPEVLDAYAMSPGEEAPLFESSSKAARREAMKKSYTAFIPPAALSDPSDRWWSDVKASDAFLDRVFAEYFKALGLPNLLRKADYHVLAPLVPKNRIDDEVRQKLDAIANVAASAKPRRE